MNTADLLEVVFKIAVYFSSVVAVVVGMRYAIKELSRDYTRISSQMQHIGEKVDDVQKTLVTIQTNAARHDQRASDIQTAVASIGERVTYLERNLGRIA